MFIFDNKRTDNSRIIIQLHPLTLQIIKIWRSATEIYNELSLDKSFIGLACKGIYKQCGGYFWRYYDEYINSQYIRCDRNNQCDITNFILPGGNLNNYIQSCFQILPGEEFRDIEGYEGLYQISNLGRVISLWNKPYVLGLKLTLDSNSYQRVKLCCINHIKKDYLVHQLVGKAFIPNPDVLPCINHKDENKLNNCVWNLEWCTAEYNVNYGTGIKRRTEKRKKVVEQLDIVTGEVINEFKSIKEIEEKFGYHSGYISGVCLGKYKTAYGFIWRHKNKF